MPRRAINWLVLGFAALWFNVVLPVHKRGQIALGWEAAPASSAKTSHACCKPSKTHSAPESSHCPDGKEHRHGGSCAVCFFMAALSTPPPVAAVERRYEYAGDSAVIARVAPESHRFPLPLKSRAPPLA